MSRAGRFSVVMPAFNAANFISDALASVAAADGVDLLDEVIVVDDASGDATAAVAAQALATHSLTGRVLRNATNLGAGASRGRGFEAAESPLIACVDADDLCTPNRFSDPLRRLENPAIQLVGGDLVMFADSRFPPPHKCLPFSSDRRIRQPTDGHDIAAALLFYCPIYAGVSTFRRDMLEMIALPRARVGEDWLFAHRVVRAYGCKAAANTGTVLAHYRRHTHQLTRNAFIDNAPVYPVWSEILSEAAGVHATQDEMEIHAMFAGPVNRPIASQAQWVQWQSWVGKLVDGTRGRNYVPGAVASALAAASAQIAPDGGKKVHSK